MPVKKAATKKAAPVVKGKIFKPVAVKINPKHEIYKKLLLKMKEQIVGDIRNLSDENSGSGNDRGGDVSGHALHMADVATDMYDREFTLGLAANEREMLYEIDEALNRIKDGSYGMCGSCKKAVLVARLKAIPYARTCMKCQEALDAKRR